MIDRIDTMEVVENLNLVFAKYQDDSSNENLEQVMKAGKKLIYHVMYTISHGTMQEDLVQAGYEGLLKALHKFDTTKETSFTTYAYYCIMGQIRLELRKERNFNRPLWIVQLQHKIIEASDSFIQKHERMPTRKELATRINIMEEGITEAMVAGSKPLDELDYSLFRSQEPESFRLPIEDSIALHEALGQLSKLQKSIIESLFYKGQTQEETAATLHMSRSKVYRIYQKALKSLRELLQ